jgi:hypothetical protein
MRGFATLLLVFVMAALPSGAALCEASCARSASSMVPQSCHASLPEAQGVRVGSAHDDCRHRHGTDTFVTGVRPQPLQRVTAAAFVFANTSHISLFVPGHRISHDRSRGSPPPPAPSRITVLRI